MRATRSVSSARRSRSIMRSQPFNRLGSPCWPALSFDRRHQARVAPCRGRVDAGHAFDREARDIVRTAGLGPGTAQALAAKGLAFDHGADLVAVDIEVADAGMLLDIIAHGVDPALKAEGQAVAGRIDRFDHLVELVASKA